ncbi:DJ-1/PfpI family protein [Actinokineospora auranticolor]|uniref:DJ-1/PfpI family protein n=1 Tax=Actinokineospora auranticolor TaxID=155976 RepID=A0A2S6GEH1_9PSEU|nr:DJ-1/PfpI family protein [Actinokineospora auranticolor]PPK63624.1 DJ-1/PfpI family protein [Actinokineospora auranticolor]
MRIAILLFERFTALDAVGPYEILAHAPGNEVVFVAEREGPVVADSGSLRLVAESTLDQVPDPDMLLVPGGPGQEEHMTDGPIHEWLRQADESTAWTTSVCTGSLILAAAGLLTGRKATSHWALAHRLPEYGATQVDERVVFDGKYVTAAGVSAGIDMGLALLDRIAGPLVAQTMQLVHEYDPQPPHNTGSPRTAPPELVEHVRGRLLKSFSG